MADETGKDDGAKQGMVERQIEDELGYTSQEAAVADDIVLTAQLLDDILDDWPYRGLTWTLANEVVWMRAAGDALVTVMQSGSDAGWDAAIDAWQEARRG